MEAASHFGVPDPSQLVGICVCGHRRDQHEPELGPCDQRRRAREREGERHYRTHKWPCDCSAYVDLGEALERAREVGNVIEWRSRDESAAPSASQVAAATTALASALPRFNPSGVSVGDGASGDRPHRPKKKTDVGPRHHSELLEVLAECQDCPWRADSRNAAGLAPQHAKFHDHQVVVTQTMKTTYERPHDQPRAQLSLSKD